VYRLVFHLIIPVYKTTRKIKKGFREMQSRMEEQMKQQGHTPHPSQAKPEPRKKASDYIDFEEVK
jgi:Sec-independent protein translocase protein TatA